MKKRNHGSILLAQTGLTQQEIAKRLRCGRTVVLYWISGQRLPRDEHRAAMKELFKIPLGAWDKPPMSTSRAKVTELVDPIPLGIGNAAAAEEPVQLMSLQARAAKIERILVNLLERSEKDQATTDLEKAKILGQATAALGQLGKMTGHTLEVSESKIVRLPAFERIREAMIRVLSPWPDALRALGEELQKIGGER